MKFTLNLWELYKNLHNEYDEPISDYLSYEEFLESLKEADIDIVRHATGDFLCIDIVELGER